MTELEKMEKGYLWNDFDEYLEEQRIAKELLYEFNQSRPSEAKRRIDIMQKLFGHCGNNVWINQPMQLCRGTTISIGDECYLNYGSCPDVELLPVLARVLKTDVNTLLCFKQELPEPEVINFATKVTELAMAGKIQEAFAIAEQKIWEFPTDVQLIHTLAMTLQGVMMMSEATDQEKEAYDQKLQTMYERVGSSGNSKYADRSNYMLASRAIIREEYEHAQELIDRLPEYSALDSKMLQANLWMKTGKESEAEKVYASRLLSGINQVAIPLTQLITIAVKNGDSENAARLVECGQTMTKELGLWDCSSYIYSFEKAMAEKNTKETLRLLDEMLAAMLIPWDISKCPIYRHLGNDKQEINLGEKMLPGILAELENSEKYDFLRGEAAFGEILSRYQV